MVVWRLGISLFVFNLISPIMSAVEHSKRNSISPLAHVLFSICHTSFKDFHDINKSAYNSHFSVAILVNCFEAAWLSGQT